MTRRSVRQLAVAVVSAGLVATAPLITAQPAFAQYPPTSTLTIQDADLILQPGQVVPFTATGFLPNETTRARLVRIAAGTLGRSAAIPHTPTTAGHPPATTPQTGTGGDSVALGRWTADVNGIVDATATVPRNIREGLYKFQITGERSHLVLSVQVSIESNTTPGHPGHPGGQGNPNHHGSPSLADTGQSDRTLTLIGATGTLLLLLGGSGLALARRRRNTTHTN